MRSIPKERQKPWLLRATMNKSLDLLRRKKRLVALKCDLPAQFDEEISLAEEMKALSPDDRELVYLFYFEGYSSKEIASLLGIRDASVRKRLERAKKKLKQILETQS